MPVFCPVELLIQVWEGYFALIFSQATVVVVPLVVEGPGRVIIDLRFWLWCWQLVLVPLLLVFSIDDERDRTIGDKRCGPYQCQKSERYDFLPGKPPLCQ